MIVGEWMNITSLEKKGEKFVITPIDGLQKTGGWWNCIEAYDFDQDGDLDFIVGNRGLNSTFNASLEHPAKIYWGDFDDNEDLDAIPCYYYASDQAMFPRHGLDQLFMQMKNVRKIFPDYESYSTSSLEKIIPNRENFKTVETFASSYIENLGNGKMKITPLTLQAQFSFVQDILIKDVNKDGQKDVVLVGNNYGVDTEMGRSDASYGVVLLNNKGKLEVAPVTQTGFSTNALDSRFIVEISEEVIAVSNNNGPLQFFKLGK